MGIVKYLTLTIVALILFSTIYGQALPTKKEQYQFLRWYIAYKKPNHLKRDLVHISDAQISTGDGYRMAQVKFTKADRKYFSRQMEVVQQIASFDTILLKTVKWKKPDEPDQPFRQLSLPIFSCDRKLLIITNNYYNMPNGIGESETGLELYVKIKEGVWHIAPVLPFDRVIAQSIE